MVANKSARRCLATLDIFIALMGLTLLAAGVWLYMESGLLTWLVINLFNKIEYSSYVQMGYMLLAIAGGMAALGALMLIAAMLGMCGGYKGSRACIVIYLTMVIFLILLQVTLLAMTIAYYSQTDSWLRGKMLVLLQSYDGPTATDDISEGWNSLFRNAKCCAVNDQYSNGNTNSDFTDVSATWTAGSNKVPATCCQGVEKDTVSYYETNTALCTASPINYYEMGSWDRVRQTTTVYLIVVVGTCLSAIIAEGCWDRVRQTTTVYLIVVVGTCLSAIIAEIASIVMGCVVADKSKARVAPAE